MFKIGDKIEILNNAFDGSDEPADFEWRGLKGEVIADFGDGAYEVYVAGKGTCCLIESEMGEAE